MGDAHEEKKRHREAAEYDEGESTDAGSIKDDEDETDTEWEAMTVEKEYEGTHRHQCHGESGKGISYNPPS